MYIMKKSLRIICSLLLFSFLTFGMSFETRAALPASGNLGPNGSESSVTYTLDNGTLTITGTGPTKDYNYTGSPFYNTMCQSFAITLRTHRLLP